MTVFRLLLTHPARLFFPGVWLIRYWWMTRRKFGGVGNPRQPFRGGRASPATPEGDPERFFFLFLFGARAHYEACTFARFDEGWLLGNRGFRKKRLSSSILKNNRYLSCVPFHCNPNFLTSQPLMPLYCYPFLLYVPFPLHLTLFSSLHCSP